MRGELTIGELMAFQTLMLSFITPFNEIVSLGGRFQEAEGDMNRLDDVLRYKVDARFEAAETAPPASALPAEEESKLSGRIEIRNLTFGYNRSAEPLIQGFNLVIEPGARVAIVGGSGSGKSTIARVVAGLYAAWEGDILFDGHPRSSYPRSVITNSIAMIDQDIFMFQGKISDNLTLWDGTIPENQIIQAAKDAAIHNDIVERPGGYEHVVEEGGRNFSGGQLQRMEIARALVNNPSIVIMDEATSALDPLTEKTIDDNLRRRGCTCLIIAHRLSTIRDADEIIVLDRGQVIERGTHEKLKKAGGLYSDLISAEAYAEEQSKAYMEYLF
jgi:ABC-type bacteriocin/lantibiotic exporter with double-glycine peptidase domain